MKVRRALISTGVSVLGILAISGCSPEGADYTEDELAETVDELAAELLEPLPDSASVSELREISGNCFTGITGTEDDPDYIDVSYKADIEDLDSAEVGEVGAAIEDHWEELSEEITSQWDDHDKTNSGVVRATLDDGLNVEFRAIKGEITFEVDARCVERSQASGES